MATPVTYGTDYQTEQQKIDRRRKLAEMLQQQSLQQDQGQMVGNVYVPTSPLQGVSKLVQAMMARKGMDKADTQQTDLQNKTRQELIAGLKAYQSATDPKAATASLLESNNPMLQQIGMSAFSKSANGPANELEYYMNLPEDQRNKALEFKRNPYLNMGGEFKNILTGEQLQKTVSPDAQPALKGQQAAAVGVAENQTLKNSIPIKTALEESVSSAKVKGEAQGKRDFNMAGVSDLMDSAEAILTGKVKPTSSGLGAAEDKIAALVGISPSGAAEADQLRAIGGNLVAKMPRMEGPQSNYDVQNYKEMAGDVGNPNLPIERRLAALKSVREIVSKYDKSAPAASPAPTGGWSIRQVK